ncbi:hypothetical protein SAMN05216345_11754 [Cupriavidus sp. YR651]|uniref:hypothetical protein n=1 Tax=Cupriavidus sp. YR651 TaxID=1855315 RepID=UPI00088A8054|nr:hypothetical protein [Cupriavidus sp. YR651]SDD82320.1 hypothetical protein SAMN05216345_11754 [Cupriavidus sp. YR651]
MQAQADFLFQLSHDALEAFLRTTSFAEETRRQFVKAQLRAIDDDIRGADSALTRIGHAKDWNAFHGLPAQFYAEQLERNGALAREYGKLTGEAGAALIEYCREATESWLRQQRDVLALGEGYQPLTKSMHDFFEEFGKLAAASQGAASKPHTV